MSDRENQDLSDVAEGRAHEQASAASVEAKRLLARRRFMRMGAGGTAGLMVTVVHKRAFGAKKTTVQSLCGSLQGTPNFIKNGAGAGMTSKKITLSAMGTPKGLVCNAPPRGFNTTRNNEGRYFVVDGPFSSLKGNPTVVPESGDPDKAKIYTFADQEVEWGGANLSESLTYGNEWRLVEKGWCPIYVDGNGLLQTQKDVKVIKKADFRFSFVPVSKQMACK